MAIRKGIINLIEKSIKDLQREGVFPEFAIPEIKIGHPENREHGDYASNVAMVISKAVKKGPMEIAEILKKKLGAKNGRSLKQIEVAKPGFINFFVAETYLQKQVGQILTKGKKFGDSTLGKKKKTNVEFISANPTGLLHIGNGRGAFFGDCLANVLKKTGYKVTKEYYFNDSRNSNQIQELGKTTLGLGESYLTPYLKSLILELKPHIKAIKSETDAGYFLAQNIIGITREFIQDKLKIEFDYWSSEHTHYRLNKAKIVYAALKKKKLTYREEGATWLNLSKFGQKDEVLIRKTGQPTYFFSDIVYHQDKIDRGFQKIIDIWGADHQGHIPRTRKVMEILGFKGEFDILITQLVCLKKGKMSKRKGDIITLEWLVDEVGLDAARFFYLTKSLDSQMEFDVQLAKDKSSKSPVYYVQYAHARICSILKKCKTKSKLKDNFKLLNHQSEISLIRQLIKFPEIIEDIAKDYQVQRLPQYVMELATAFHQFYRDCRVIGDDKALTAARMSLVLATKTILGNSLELMGISAPEKM